MNPPRYAVVAVDMSARQRAGLLARHAATPDQSDARHPLSRSYHYLIPPEMEEQLVPGQLLWVPFGREQRRGLLLGFDDAAPVAEVRALSGVARAEPFLQPHLIALARWMSDFYLAPLWDTLLLILPPGVLQGSERRLKRTSRTLTTALPKDARRLLAWLEGEPEGGTMREAGALLGGEAAARRAASALLQAGLVRDEMVLKPPGVRPRVERFVRATLPAGGWKTRLSGLGRRSRAADLLEEIVAAGGRLALSGAGAASRTEVEEVVARGWARFEPGRFLRRGPESADRLSRAQRAAVAWLADQGGRAPEIAASAAGHRRATLEALLRREVLQREGIGPDHLRLLLPPARLPLVLDGLRGSGPYRAVLLLLDQQGGELTASEIAAATGATSRHLERLEEADLVQIERREVLRNPLAERQIAPTVPPPFTPEQALVWQALAPALADRTGGGLFLLHGVTGSGKTEIYLRAVAETLARGRQAIVLVPEIALTPQTIARFGARFGELIALQHSQLSEGERYDEWRRLRDGRAQIAIGSRSALFAPLPQLGLIVMDEAHEWTYKQGFLPGYRFPQYHAREVAERLAELTGATVLLGSATPSVESYYRAEQGRYRLLEMGQRVLSRSGAADGVAASVGELNTLVPVQVVDMREELRARNTSIFSRELRGALSKTLDAGEQAILFLNRRGENAFVMCRDCGWVQECPQCDVPMTFHSGRSYLICHQCSATAPLPHHCPNCLSPRVKHFGVGTQQVERVTGELFPSARILRWDRDTSRGRGAHEALLRRFAGGEAEILIGTQMIAKGLDLPLVTLVGIVSADTALHLPDFRSGERTFQLLTQVAGRAGRSVLGGRVILQTYTPRHYAIVAASRHNYHRFYEHEIAFRRDHAYPPVAPLVRLVYRDTSERGAAAAAERQAERMRLQLQRLGLAATEVLGPAPAFFSRLRGRYRWQILVRGLGARELVRATLPGAGWEVDVEPTTVL